MHSNAEAGRSDPSYLEMVRHQVSGEEATETDDLGAFGWLRGQKERAVMLELRRRNGNIIGLGYAWLERAEFDPSAGITLYFMGKAVRITGSNLNSEVRPHVRMFNGILRHRVPWIQETSQVIAMRAAKDAVVIERIEVK
ncbi:MAG TPA: hypothetical protein VHC22_21790 [Pirellulales bacterium]|nr:hypothetical protein [Pirellulales bacterium]